MLQTCSIVAQLIIDQLIDDDVGFSDFLYSEKTVLETAVQKHWHYLAEKDPRFKDPTETNDLYFSLIKKYMVRTNNPVNPNIYRAYIRLMAETELKKLPIFQRLSA